MKKILALLLAFMGFGFAACDHDNDDDFIMLYGVRATEYQEKGPASIMQDVNNEAEYPTEIPEETTE